ncbi:hypothetical protein B0H12DRAFT_1267521 [Mycena haematopus]|nr:hypothetical protein B0H12DRAFT_1267521 [Mycena haematopus]
MAGPGLIGLLVVTRRNFRLLILVREVRKNLEQVDHILTWDWWHIEMRCDFRLLLIPPGPKYFAARRRVRVADGALRRVRGHIHRRVWRFLWCSRDEVRHYAESDHHLESILDFKLRDSNRTKLIIPTLCPHSATYVPGIGTLRSSSYSPDT